MKILQRAFAGEADKQQMRALVQAWPAGNVHVVDLPYRLSSWAFDAPENMAVWVDRTQHILAWAIFQTPFWTIDYAYHPVLGDTDIPQRILAWADDRARQIVNSPAGHPMWFINVFANQAKHIRDVEQSGFVCQSDVAENAWSKVFMARAGKAPVAAYPPPAGFQIRPLNGEAEVDAYVALHQAVFQSKSMTRAWRKNTLQQREYRPELDLVAEAPDGRLAAFCIGWFNQQGLAGKPSAQIEPLGVHADFRKQGLGKAILAENLRRFQRLGAEQMFVETDNYRDAAFHLYASIGFQVAQQVLVFRKNYPSV